MKKLFAIVLFCSFVLGVVSPTIEIYASEQTSLNQAIDTGIATVEKLGEVANKKLETIQSKEVDISQKERIDEKQQEIEAYVNEVQKKLDSDIDSKQELNTTLVEAQKVIVLKAVSGVTEYQEVSSNIPATIAKDAKSLSSAVEVMQNTFTTKSKYSLIISTTYSKEKIQTLLSPFDSSVTVEFLYQTEEGKNVYELFISEESIFGKEMLSDIKEGNIPESLLGIEVVQPEVFTLSELTGEDINATWGVKKYNPESYLSQLDGKSPVQVAVIDTGVDFTHPDLKDNVLPGYDFVNDDSDATDDQGHGTHVSGTIAAENNGQGIVGVNPNAKIIPLKICNASGFCPNYAILRALDYVKDHHISVVNMSLGGKGDPSTNPVCESIAAVTQAGTIVVSAAGNSNVNTSTFVPGGCKDVITVGAVDESLTRASFSNYGDKVDVSAPGVGIYSAAIGGGYKKLSGTSMAAPHITGLVSVIKGIKGNVSIDEMKSILRQTGGKTNTSLDKKIGSFVLPSDAIAYFNTKKDVVENPVGTGYTTIQNGVSLEKDVTKIDENLSKESEQSFSGTGDIKVFLDSGSGNFGTTYDLPTHPIEVPLEGDSHIDSILPANFEGSGDVQISAEVENAKFTPFLSTEFTGASINSIDESQLIPYQSASEDLHIGGTISSSGVTVGSYEDVIKIPIDTTTESSGIVDIPSIQSVIDYRNVSVVVGNSVFVSIPEMTTKLKAISVTAPGVVNLYSLPSNGGILISAGNLPGTTQIYVRDYFTQEITHIVYVEVTPPISYETVQYDPQVSLTGYLRVGGTVMYTNGSYSYSFSNPGIVQLSSYSGVMYRTFLAPGKTDLYVYRNGQLQSMVRYTVLPLPKPIECNIVEGQKCVIPIGVLGQYTVEPYDANAQFGIYSNGDNTGGFYVQGMREGQAIIRVRSQAASWFLDTIINVKVSPAPIPQEASCTIVQNQRCDIVLYNSSRYTFSQSNPGYISTSIQESAVLIYGALPGKTDFYIKKDGVIVHTLHITVLRSDTVFINYEYTTSPTAHYMHISPLIYGHTGNKTLAMSASIGDMKLVKKGETTNLLKNGNFSGNGLVSQGWTWIGGQSSGWNAYIYGNGNIELSGNRLNLQINGGGSYVEARTTDGGYFGVTPDSIPVEPNTTYVLMYNYFIDYVSGDSDHGFTVNILTQSSNGVRSGEAMSMPFIKNPRAGGDSYKALKLSTDTINIKVGDTAYFNIVGGNNGYGFSKNNYNISVYSASTDGLKYRVVGNTVGTSLIQVTDSVGKKATITVNVGASSSNIVNQAPATSTAPTTGFVGNSTDGFSAVNFDYINELESGVLYFQLPTTLNPKEVGIEYKNSVGAISSQILALQPDGTYMEFIDKGTNIGFVPYYVTQAGAKVYYNSKSYISFAEIGVQNVEDEGVEVSSLPLAFRCEAGNSGNFWTRPFNAVCVDDIPGKAWSCKDSNYKDLNPDGKGINSCVLKTYYDGQYKSDKLKIDAYISKIKSVSVTDYNKALASIKKLEDIQSRYIGTAVSVNKKEYFTVILDQLRNDLDKKINPQTKDYQDLISWFQAFSISANGGFYLDGPISEYTGKSRAEIENYAQRFAEEMFNYQYKYDATFKAGYDARVLAETTKQESIFGTLTAEQKTQIAQGVKDGVIIGTKDYVMQRYDLAVGISDLKLSDIYSGVKNSWNFVASSVTNFSGTYESFKQTLTNIYDKINSLVYYDYSYGGSYVGTNIGLSAADPTGKIMAAVGGGFIRKIEGVVDITIQKRIFGTLVSSDRRDHILVGDATGGGHKFGAGMGKTEFPQGWSDDKIIQSIESIVSDSNSKIFSQTDGRVQVFGTRDGINIKVIVDPKTKSIITGYPQ